MIVVIEPLIMLSLLILSFIIWPPIAPYIVWIPYVGSVLGGQATACAQSHGTGDVLTRRLEKVQHLAMACISLLNLSHNTDTCAFAGSIRTGCG